VLQYLLDDIRTSEKWLLSEDEVTWLGREDYYPSMPCKVSESGYRYCDWGLSITNNNFRFLDGRFIAETETSDGDDFSVRAVRLCFGDCSKLND